MSQCHCAHHKSNLGWPGTEPRLIQWQAGDKAPGAWHGPVARLRDRLDWNSAQQKSPILFRRIPPSLPQSLHKTHTNMWQSFFGATVNTGKWNVSASAASLLLTENYITHTHTHSSMTTTRNPKVVTRRNKSDPNYLLPMEDVHNKWFGLWNK